MKILITGYTGMLGIALVKEFFQKNQLFGIALENTQIRGIEGYQLNLVEQDSVLPLIQKIQPDLIIHTAAMTNVDQCEQNPLQASRVNFQATQNITQAAEKADASLVYISTDFVFDGQEGNYKEEDSPHPKNIYGRTKLEGEREVTRIKRSLVLRTTIYGWNLLHASKLSLPEMVIKNLSQDKEFTAFQDQYFTPLYVGRLAEFIKRLYNKQITGVIHAVGDERMSKYEFACLTADVWGLNKELIRPISFKEADYQASRPRDASLKNNKLKKILGISNISLKKDLEKMKKDYEQLKSLI